MVWNITYKGRDNPSIDGSTILGLPQDISKGVFVGQSSIEMGAK
jgi:hypothetical protein